METTQPKPNSAAPGGASFGGNRGGNAGGRGGNRGGGGRGGQRGGGGRKPGGYQSFGDVKPEFDQKTLSVRRVTRVVAGGRRFAFSVVLAIGDRKGQVGVGVGKAGDTAQAIDKAYSAAKRSMLKLRLTDKQSLPHDGQAKYNSARVYLTPNRGRGIVAGSAVRVVLDLGGVNHVTSKVLSPTKNKLNIARATLETLKQFTAQKKS